MVGEIIIIAAFNLKQNLSLIQRLASRIFKGYPWFLYLLGVLERLRGSSHLRHRASLDQT